MSLKQELESEQVAHLDLSDFQVTESGTAVHTALAEMRQNDHSVCLIVKEEQLIGILTERDVLRKVVVDPTAQSRPVDDFMTANPVTVTPDTPALQALWIMDERHFRDLPVVDNNGRIHGNMTHQAVINYLATQYPVEVLNRPPRPSQFPRKPEGGD